MLPCDEHDASMHAQSISVSLWYTVTASVRLYAQDECSNGVEINNRLLSGDQLLLVCYPCFSVFCPANYAVHPNEKKRKKSPGHPT